MTTDNHTHRNTMTQQATTTRRCTLGKAERLCSLTLIDKLFRGGESRSLSAYPLRMVYMPVDREGKQPPAQILVSVPKKHLHHAVDRNRVKRQAREAYRLHKHALHDAMAQLMPERQMLVAFIYLDSRLHDSDKIHAKVNNLLQRLTERMLLTAQQALPDNSNSTVHSIRP